MLNSIKISIAAASVVFLVTGCSVKDVVEAHSKSNHHCDTFITTGKCSGITHNHAPVVDGDADSDGVLDSMDKCPRSAPYTSVDANGCEVTDGDDDNDGVANSIDKCQNTPAGKEVNRKGCVVDGDNDNDGVANSIDKCPNTPAGKEVNSEGCVVDGDDDKDGVLNSMDKCPTTLANVTKVDTEGCAAEVNLQVQFEFDSSKVKEASMTNIVNFANFMNEHTSYKARIEGHTDTSGQALYNDLLSKKRAQAVSNLIVSEGKVDASRLTAVGKGSSTPVASNATRDGRKANRRTEAHIIK